VSRSSRRDLRRRNVHAFAGTLSNPAAAKVHVGCTSAACRWHPGPSAVLAWGRSNG
jgi:hypothetical protein